MSQERKRRSSEQNMSLNLTMIKKEYDLTDIDAVIITAALTGQTAEGNQAIVASQIVQARNTDRLVKSVLAANQRLVDSNTELASNNQRTQDTVVRLTRWMMIFTAVLAITEIVGLIAS